MSILSFEDTIVALSTAQGVGAIAVIRLSGKEAFSIVDSCFEKRGKAFSSNSVHSHTAHFGVIKKEDVLIDEVLTTLFKAPNSYTAEDVAEVSCHASPFIQQELLNLFISKGARLAQTGEFTQRSFLNGKMDLSQAEAVADLIASETKVQHEIAIQQVRGGFSNEIKQLREQLINFASLLELELDFSEEDVEFADRTEFLKLVDDIQSILKNLIDSFAYGNVIKDGVPVAILGKPNAGKSSLLNALLNEERAIVSDIPGTTRDTVEDVLTIDGIKFRFIDTAGLRDTNDKIEAIGVQKAKEKASQSKILMYLYDRNDISYEEIIKTIKELAREGLIILLVENKVDLLKLGADDTYIDYLEEHLSNEVSQYIAISAHNPNSIESVKQLLLNQVRALQTESNQIVTNTRHHAALLHSLSSLQNVKEGLNHNLSGDLVAIDIKESLRYLGEITGEVDVDRDILGTIFGKFCIGK